MLELRFSADRLANTEALLARICRPPFEKKRYLIVPEQFSHDAELRLCLVGGDTVSAHAEVVGFSRLAERVFAAQGGVAATQTDAVGRLLFMSLAAEQVASRLKVFASVAQKPDFQLLMLQMIDEFDSFRISPQVLREAAGKLDGALALKAEEFALLTESYRAVCAAAGQNPKTKLTRLLEALESGDFAAKHEYYFDGFTDFNGVQREIIAQLLASGVEVCVTVCCAAPDGHEQQFATARQTAQSFLAMAARLEVKVRQTRIGTSQPEALSALRASLFTGAQSAEIPEGFVSCTTAQDALRECQAAAGEILHLLRGGARLRDIGIAAADFAGYAPALRSVLARAQIPAYFAGTEDLLHCAPVHALLCALRAASGEAEQEDVLDYLKSGFSPVTDAQADRLEDYILLWQLTGARLFKPWTGNPLGARKEADEASRAELEDLNALRGAALDPLGRLRGKLRTAGTLGQMTTDFYDFIEQSQWNERVAQQAQALYAQGELRQAQIYSQLPKLLCTLLEQLYGTLCTAVRTPEEFFALLRAAIGQSSAGTIPASADCVTVGSLASMRRSRVQYLFVLGANEGAFPAAGQSASLLTDSERGRLFGCGIELLPDARGRLERELAGIDGVLSAAQKRLFVSAVSGSESYYFKRIARLCGKAPEAASQELLIRHSPRDYLSQLTALRGVCADEKVNEEARKIYARAAYQRGNLSEQTARLLYGRSVRLSSTRIDRLASCELAHFLQYGLRAKKRETAQLDASLYGEFVHEVLRYTVCRMIDLGGVHCVNEAQIERFAQEAIDRFARERMEELLRDEREAYLFTRSFPDVRKIAREMYAELAEGSFEPCCAELYFGKSGEVPAVSIRARRVEATLEGYVDRVDFWRDGESVYLRVVDYKTGKKKFDYAAVLGGIGLQMLLYLFSVLRSAQRRTDAKLLAAGVEYFPARTETIHLTDRNDLAELEKKREKSLSREGLFLKDARVLRAMEHRQPPRYLPYECGKDDAPEGALADSEQLGQLERYVFGTVAEMADRLGAGQIDRPPCEFADSTGACSYCDFAEFCGKAVEKRQLGRVGQTEFWNAIGAYCDEQV